MANNPTSLFRPTERGLTASPFLVLQRQMNRLLEDVFGPDTVVPSQTPEAVRGILSPRVEVTETETAVRIVAELPGVKEQDIDVSLDSGVLTLRAEKKAERREERENTHFTERSYGVFERALQLPFQADPDEVNAAFEHGVLTITITKPKGRDQRRKIEVRGAPARTETPANGSSGAEA
jgi:HSP20 family protein